MGSPVVASFCDDAGSRVNEFPTALDWPATSTMSYPP